MSNTLSFNVKRNRFGYVVEFIGMGPITQAQAQAETKMRLAAHLVMTGNSERRERARQAWLKWNAAAKSAN